jgi:hypothetical protein
MKRGDLTYKEPVQLVLEFFISDEEEDHKYSQSIELYDSIPKYVWGKVQRSPEGFLPTLRRAFTHRKVEYEVEISPARIVLKNGKEREYYPGVREELVEDALRKIATEGRLRRTENGGCGVDFSLYELKKELARTGHTYSLTQIKESLTICKRANIVLYIKGNGNKIEADRTLFSDLVFAEKDDWKKGKRAYVEFNPLVTKSIKQKTFRQINYERSMQITSSLARWLHKRMSHNYKQAQSFSNYYTINLTTIVRDSGISHKRLGDSRKAVVQAMDELKTHDVLYQYTEDSVKGGRQLLDVKFTLTPTLVFSREMKRANKLVTMLG